MQPALTTTALQSSTALHPFWQDCHSQVYRYPAKLPQQAPPNAMMTSCRSLIRTHRQVRIAAPNSRWPISDPCLLQLPPPILFFANVFLLSPISRTCPTLGWPNHVKHHPRPVGKLWSLGNPYPLSPYFVCLHRTILDQLSFSASINPLKEVQTSLITCCTQTCFLLGFSDLMTTVIASLAKIATLAPKILFCWP